MKTQFKWALSLLLLASAATGNLTGAALNVGDPAPSLQVSKWVQGDPVKEFEAGKVYIVEFWATWCGPCRVSIPHVNEIHNKYKEKGLVVIGQDVWETDVAAVAPFVEKMGDKMTYRVALDQVEKGGESKGKMAETWMEAAGERGIPSAFVVNQKGKIAWIGHPMTLKEQILEQIIEGKYDVEKAATERKDRKEREGKMQLVWRDLNRHVQKEEWDQAESKLKEVEEILPKDEQDGLVMVRFRIMIGKKDYPAAFKLAGDYSDDHKEEAGIQNSLAWEIATNKDIKDRDLALARKIATRAYQASNEKEPAIIDTLARVMFLQGEKEKAIELQKRAVSLAEGNSKKELQKILESYQAGKEPEE